ncbi:MAG: 30S ribosomal protein S17 [Omnitrophica bacterium RIFCSPLOWO2_12_FULL_44_17]|uniref:Small ribosomal subunit protein uS17 n=1 Tax=Candidatus Danuiimicrobium aquiferis TaxID=1801832 RepID=A0A1G1KZZ6_9BACT|nr:MAG: 30S ribosomal protein S17 [Omnitrophica bacterium RIFCSPHIGHO2_02_FULL_45_28]OGW91769.1 MAG: 30S ribosomal protein S17 [Omnitrophica bacterium RIFCSPHIGHO2_12_FULL_44_12]OGW98473.1 MAG: 30S ribosomal protein S17 [Omnitrophica bacterium RIFCSPLOWO2_12_FULL_44_17]OGX02920.1 MAG: 30S ribosomal protein S17 [Omnitrophica bacterium RIFCSPLOWO2_02_FULL_44_11]
MTERHHKERVGVVKSNKMKKTLIVEVTRLVQHSMYKKVVKQRKKYSVHDEKGVAKLGDKVKIREVKPLSKTKRWALVEVLAS